MKQVHLIFFVVCFFPLYVCGVSLQYYCTAANSEYYPHLLNLIGSIHKHNFDDLGEIAVFDLGLKNQEIEQLKRIKKVSIHMVEKVHPDMLHFFSLEGRRPVLGWFIWKPVIIKQAVEMFEHVLWVDAGATVLKNLNHLFRYIQQQGYFLITIGDETYANGAFKHGVDWQTTEFVKQKYNLYTTNNKWVLSREAVTTNVLGASRKAWDSVVFPFYELTQDLRNFQDDGTAGGGSGAGRHEQALISIMAYLSGWKVHVQDYTQNIPIYLDIDGKQVPFYTTWNAAYVNDKTDLYSSRWDLRNSNHYYSCIRLK